MTPPAPCTRTRRPAWRAAALWLTLIAAVSGLPGCAGVAWLVNIFAGTEKVPPKYKLSKDDTVLVFVDDYQRPVSYAPIKQDLTKKLNKELLKYKLVGQVIDYDQFMNLSLARSDFRRMSIPDVGRALGADTVIYVDITRLQLKENDLSPLWQGKMECMVKVVDSTKGPVWPEDRAEGYPVACADARPSENLSESYGIQVAERMATRMAVTIATMFRETERTRGAFAEDPRPAKDRLSPQDPAILKHGTE